MRRPSNITVNGETILQEYSLPPLIGPAGGEVVKMDPFLGLGPSPV